MNRVSTARRLIPLLSIGVTGNSVLYIMPLLVGGMVTDRGFSDQQAGYLASADLAGFALATVGVALLVDRLNWRWTAHCALALMIAANAATTHIYVFSPFAAIRFLSGFGGGVLVGLATVGLGRLGNPDQNYGMMYASSLLSGTLGLRGLPLLQSRFGSNVGYHLITGLALLALPIAVVLPASWPARMASGEVGSGQHRLMCVAVLAAILLFLAEQNAVWAYAERIGRAAGLTERFMGFSLGVGTLWGFAGSALVGWAGSTFGRLVPLSLATLLQLVCFILLAGQFAPMTYLISIAILNIAWNLINPLQLAILAQIDPAGKTLALSATATSLGLAIGPAAAARVIEGQQYGILNWLAGVLAIVCSCLLVPALRIVRDPAPSASTTDPSARRTLER